MIQKLKIKFSWFLSLLGIRIAFLRFLIQTKDNSRLLFAGVGIILFWRGVWIAADQYLFPENLNLSLIASIILGAAIIISMKIKNL
ncbi:MAG: hypothetical protein ACK40G_13320 [Cytophagaceae bacterium]